MELYYCTFPLLVLVQVIFTQCLSVVDYFYDVFQLLLEARFMIDRKAISDQSLLLRILL